MSEFGKFTELTFVNGAAPAINAANLNELERVVNLADNEFARSSTINFEHYKEYFYQRNLKEIETFTDYTSFTAAASTTRSADTTNVIINSQAVKMAESDAVASWIGMYKTISAIDLTAFNDSSASSTSDCIQLCFYISNTAKFDYIQFKLGTDNTNNYSAVYDMSTLRTGWNCLYLMKSEFTNNGTPPLWSNITYVRFEAYTKTGASGEYITFQQMQLVRADPVSAGYCNPFQKYNGTTWENVFTIDLDSWMLYYDDVQKCLMIQNVDQYNAASNQNSLQIYDNCICFIANIEKYTKYVDGSPGLTWYIDSDNFVEFRIDNIGLTSATLTINTVVSGVSTEVTKAFTNYFVANDRVNLTIEKTQSVLRILGYKDYEAVKILEVDNPFSDSQAGKIYLGHYGTCGNWAYRNFTISNSENDFSSWKYPKVATMTADMSWTSDTSMSNVPGMYFDLPPNSVFLIEAYLLGFSTSSTPDIQFDWSITGVTFLSERFCFGAAVGTADADDTNMKATTHQAGTDVAYGLDASNGSTIRESILVKTTKTGGRIQLRGSQEVSNGTASKLLDESFMVCTKLRT